MMVRMSGSDQACARARKMYPNYMDRVGHGRDDDPVDFELVQALADLGLTVHISPVYNDWHQDVWCEPGTGPFCKLPTAVEEYGDNDEDEDDEDY